MTETNSRRPLILGGALVTLIALVVILAVFQPQKLFIDDKVDEALPTSTGEPVADDDLIADETMAEDMPGENSEPDVLASGNFADRSHPASGQAKIIELDDGSRFLRIEDLDTDNGPDLFVYLTTAGPDADSGDYDDDGEFVNLGRLKGNIGNQNYEVPLDVDLDRFATVALWCDRFNVVFGTAGLTATA